MSNILLQNHNSSYLSNSEYYRYQKVREASFSKTNVEEVLILIAKNDLVSQLIAYEDNGLNLNFHFTQGNYLIHTMAQYNAVDCVRYLIERGVDMNRLSSYGSTPLENALAAGADETAEYLKSLGAKSNVTTLKEMLSQARISSTDRDSINMAIDFNDELTDIIVNLSCFAEKMLLARLHHSRCNAFFYAGMNIVLRDHLSKLDALQEKKDRMNYHMINNALLKYDLTAQQSVIFRQLYLNQDLIGKLEEICRGMNEKSSTQWLSEKSSYLSSLLW